MSITQHALDWANGRPLVWTDAAERAALRAAASRAARLDPWPPAPVAIIDERADRHRLDALELSRRDRPTVQPHLMICSDGRAYYVDSTGRHPIGLPKPAPPRDPLADRLPDTSGGPRPHWIDGALAFLIFCLIAGLVILASTGAFRRARGSEGPWATGQPLENMRALNPLPEFADDPATLYYDDRTMPPAYQFVGSTPHRLAWHDPTYNISGEAGEPHGNANREFPWREPMGLDAVPRSQARGYKFLRLPRDPAGRPLPIVWWKTAARYRWAFPIGTTVGEILTMRCGDGRWRAYEARLRHRGEHEWNIDVLRPHPTARDLAAAIGALRPNWAGEPELTAAIARLAAPAGPLETFRAPTRAGRRAVELEPFRVDELPRLPADLAAELMDPRRFPFQHATGDQWKPGCSAPTSTAASGAWLVPIGYTAHRFANDDAACAKCHETVGKSTKEFDEPRQWYGLVRGDDGILSAHPADPACISADGFSYPVRMRADLAGQLEHLDRKRHDLARYGKLDP